MKEEIRNKKILIVCSANYENFRIETHQPFIYEQVKSMQVVNPSLNVEYFFIKEKRIKGYLNSLKNLRKKIKNSQPDIVHAHFSFSGLLANLQRSVPVITTFHGCDIAQNTLSKLISIITFRLSKHNIFVLENMKDILGVADKFTVLPCGIDLEIFKPLERSQEISKYSENEKIKVLFSSNFDYEVKNFPLAKEAIEAIGDKNIELVELKGYSRSEVNNLLNNVHVALMTSKREGSPQFIKEAMAANTPVVSVDVGDVRDLIGNTEGCYITSHNPNEIAEKIQSAINFSIEKGKTDGRKEILKFNNKLIAKKLLRIYEEVLKK